MNSLKKNQMKTLNKMKTQMSQNAGLALYCEHGLSNHALLKTNIITCRLLEEVDEVVGEKENVDAEDIENLKYMQQVCTAPTMHQIGK